MNKKVVIVGSASLLEKIEQWKNVWEVKGHTVINHTVSIAEENFLVEYPKIHTRFFKSIGEADILFVMNENKNGIEGYLGAESFAEMCFGVAQNLLHGKTREIILLKMPDAHVQSYDEIRLWLDLGWITLYR